MQLCIFNPEHDLCLAKGRVHYVPPRSAVDFAHRDAGLMSALYPGATCCSVYDLSGVLQHCCNIQGASGVLQHCCNIQSVVAWGWNPVVKHELLKRGIPAAMLPSDEEINTIRELQHRSTVLPLQPDCHAVHSVVEMEALLADREHWVMKAPWSGAGRGLHWVHGRLTDIDRDWLQKTVATQRCVIAEPRREVAADVALEYMDGRFIGYSFFRTGSGVYKENLDWTDDEIEFTFRDTELQAMRSFVEGWLHFNIFGRYRGPLGVDLMVGDDGSVYVAEINFRHTMGMVAHAKNNRL